MFLRVASTEESVQIEQTRRLLDRSVRWVPFLAFFLPGVLAVIVIFWMLLMYPGTWQEKLLGIFLPLMALGGIFTLPMLLITRRTRALSSRMKRDDASGYRIILETGEVGWGKRERAYIATAGGRRLTSPSFTQFTAVPTYWHHFEKLAPGRYELETLQESNLVICAHPIPQTSGDRPAPTALTVVDRPADDALLAAFFNRHVDREKNRGGRASSSQRARLIWHKSLLFASIPLLGVISWFAWWDVLQKPTVGAVILACSNLAFTVLLFHLVVHISLDFIQGGIDSDVGTISFKPGYGRNAVGGTIGSSEFSMTPSQARAFQSGASYRVYIFHHSRFVVGAELMDE